MRCLSWGVLLTLTNSSGNANNIIMFKAVFSLLYTWLIAVNREEQPTRVRKKQKGLRCNETFGIYFSSFFWVGEAYLPVCAWRILFLFLFPQMTSPIPMGWYSESRSSNFTLSASWASYTSGAAGARRWPGLGSHSRAGSHPHQGPWKALPLTSPWKLSP